MNAIFDRRRFLQFSLAGGALLIADAPLRYARASATAGDYLGDIGPYLKINPDNTLVLGAPSPEIGTGMHTSLPMLIAEELGADFASVSVKQMPIRLLAREEGGFRWAYGVQGGGGSFTLRRNWDPVRRLAATTRNVLISAASEELGAPAGELRTENNYVVHGDGRRVSFADIAARAAAKPFPELAENEEIALKDPSDYAIVGKWQRNKGVEDVVTGKAKFGIDGDMPGMLHAVMTRSPYFKGRIVSVNDDAARAVPGVRQIVILDPPEGEMSGRYLAAGVAVVADSLWAAMKARRLLNIEWDKGESAGESSDALFAQMAELQSQPGEEFVKDGEGRAALNGAAKVVEATYELPLLAHATMEPMNCIVHLRDDEIDVVAPGHSCGGIVVNLSRAFGVPVSSINMISMRTGGSFGRRLEADMAIEAALISREANAPVKLVWTREDDIGADHYRPQSRHVLRAALNDDGSVATWAHSACLATQASGDDVEVANVMRNTIWADNYPRRLIDNFEIDVHHISWATPNGPWRAPMPTQQAFVVESFINELAAEAGADPLEFRLRLLGESRDMPYDDFGGPTYSTGRWAAVLQKAAEEAGWGERLRRRQGRGIAGYFTFGSYCAVVVEVEASRSNDIRVTRIVAAGDAGLIVNPNGFKAQLEGGVLDGLSTALRLKIDVEDGRVVQQNFDTYPFMRIADAPTVIETHLIQGADEVHGTGEIAIPPLAPALCDAIYQATGKRIRKMPIGDQLKA